MAWVDVPGSDNWEYDNDPADPGGGETALWALSSAGIRTSSNGSKNYIKCRLKGSAQDAMSELNKDYYDQFV